MNDRCKICIFYHVAEREKDSCLMIADSIKILNSNAEVIVEEFYQGMYHAFLYRPDVILTIPPRDDNTANRLMILKKIVHCAVLSLMTEGYFGSFAEEKCQVAVGSNQYSPFLIDKYLFWGEKTKDCLVSVLKKNKKIINESRAQTVGYIYYDVDKVKDFFDETKLPTDIQKWREDFRKRILVLTGFPGAEYTEKDLQIMSDFKCYGIKGKEQEYRQEVKEWEKRRKRYVEFRKKYLDCVIAFAGAYPDMGILVKMHPVEMEKFFIGEKYQCYHELEQYKNIILLKESVLVGRILPFADTVVHYGSTAGMEAYIYNVPTVQLFDPIYPEQPGEPGFCIYESTVRIDINDWELFKKTVSENIEMRHLPSVEQVLKEQFNWTREKQKEYHPTKTYAEIILDFVGKGQKIEDDAYYRSALHSLQGRDIKRYYLDQIMKNISSRKRLDIETKSYQNVLKELEISLGESIILILRIVGGRIKRTFKLKGGSGYVENGNRRK